MRKSEFIDELKTRLSGLPQDDVEERLNFYGEMIDDRIEEGLSEEDAVADVGGAEEVALRIISDIPLAKIAKEIVKPKRKLKAWEITLLAVGSPVWFSLLMAAVAVVISLYAALCSVIISLWAAFASVAACAVGGAIAGVVFATLGHAPTGVVTFAAALVCAGLSIFIFFGCVAATNGILFLTKKIAFGIKHCFIGKVRAQ